MGDNATTKLVVTSFSMIGIRRECLFKDFSAAMLAARAELYDTYDSSRAAELIFYEMTDEKLHPERMEVFYLGIKCSEKDAVPAGMEYKKIENQSFVMTTYNGIVAEIGKGYRKINEYIKDNELNEDRTSFVVELYDERFNANSADSEVEIYMPVKVSR